MCLCCFQLLAASGVGFLAGAEDDSLTKAQYELGVRSFAPFFSPVTFLLAFKPPCLPPWFFPRRASI
jgi:hypothetical protein